MFNIDYKESEHIKEVREKYLEKIKELPNKSFEDFGDFIDKLNYSIEEQTDSEEAYIYIYGYLQGQKDTMILTGVGLALGCVIGAVMNCLRK